MHQKSFKSRRVIEKRNRRLRCLEKRNDHLNASSSSEEEIQMHLEIRSPKATGNIFPIMKNDLCGDDDYLEDEHDCDDIPNKIGENICDQSPPLYDGCQFSVMESLKLLMNVLISAVNLDKQNILRILKLIKSLLPQPNNLPMTWKSILKLFGRNNSSTTLFFCSSCHNKCDQTTFGKKVCRNHSCSRSQTTLKTNEIVELVNLDIRHQLKTIIGRNMHFLLNNTDYFPKFDIAYGAFYETTTSSSMCNTITLVLHTDGAPLIRTTKQSIWPLFASVVEIPPPVREYQKNILLLSLWSSKAKPDPDTFLKYTVNEIKFLMTEGTSIFLNDKELKFVIRTQFFISDLPARSLFLRTTSFNGYYACHCCLTKGFWNGKMVVYPYDQNDFQLRSHHEFIAVAKEAQEQSTEKRMKSVNGIKGLSCLLEIMSYPQQIVLDYMHLVCLGHVQTLIRQWTELIDKHDVSKMDNMLQSIRVPHNIHVVYKESMVAVDSWKAKHGRLFVLNVGLPIGVAVLPRLYASHWAVYCIAVKLLHAPSSQEDIDFAESLINFYCQTISAVYDQCLEYYSLHAHLHLPGQVRLHGGLSFCSAFTFESCIRCIKKKVHGTKHLASQIAYWYDIENMITDTISEIPSFNGINQIDLYSEQLADYRDLIIECTKMNRQDLNSMVFYKRYKHQSISYHTFIYDKQFKCCSYIVSYIIDDVHAVAYGKIIVFYKCDDHFFAFVQKYKLVEKKISDFLELPTQMMQKTDQLYPLMKLSTEYDIVPVENFRHKCISVIFQDVLCLSEVRVDFEHD